MKKKLKSVPTTNVYVGETHEALFRGRRAKRLQPTCVAHPFWPHFLQQLGAERQTPAFYFNMQPARQPSGAGGALTIKRVRAVVAIPLCDSPTRQSPRRRHYLRSGGCIFRPWSD
jgi:hypothetical protein